MQRETHLESLQFNQK
uniref:Uncharacterized protein n=1 Tax=Anguilla anguilla TaxID=7936 RepID=A0A0E9TSY9_ANGAN